jgi:biotin transport system substrate-specific component
MSRTSSSSVAANAAINPPWLRQLGLVLIGTLILAASSYVSIPMRPVPITMQTFAVLTVGALYGWRLGTVTILAWLLEGALGLPVFSNGTGGLAAFFGPTAGYLLSFPLVGAMAGWLAAHGFGGAHPLRAFAAMLLGTTLCLFLGAAWLAVAIGWSKAWALGFVPFLIGDVIKSALGAATLALWHSASQYVKRSR